MRKGLLLELQYFEYEHALLRLKQTLKVQTDQEVAALLGMSAAAFNKRKARSSFPFEAVKKLAEARPDLEIDLWYIQTGEGQLQRIQREAGQVFSKSADLLGQLREALDRGPRDDQEAELLEDWRNCGKSDRETVSSLAKRLAKTSPTAAAPTEGKVTGKSTVTQTFHASVGQAAGRDVVNHGRGKGSKR